MLLRKVWTWTFFSINRISNSCVFPWSDIIWNKHEWYQQITCLREEKNIYILLSDEGIVIFKWFKIQFSELTNITNKRTRPGYPKFNRKYSLLETKIRGNFHKGNYWNSGLLTFATSRAWWISMLLLEGKFYKNKRCKYLYSLIE